MNARTTILNGGLKEEKYKEQYKIYVSKSKEFVIYKLSKTLQRFNQYLRA